MHNIPIDVIDNTAWFFVHFFILIKLLNLLFGLCMWEPLQDGLAWLVLGWGIKSFLICEGSCIFGTGADPTDNRFFLKCDSALVPFVREGCVFFLGVFGIGEGVDEKDLILGGGVVPVGGQLIFLSDPGLEFLQLLHVVVANLQVLLLGGDELQAFVHGPGIFLHQVGDHDRSGSRLAMEGMNQTALPLLHGLLYELEDCIDGVVFLIEDLN